MLKNRVLFNIAHRLGDETRLMDYHHQLKDNKFDQLCLAGVHYLRSHYQEATDIYKRILLENRDDLALNVYVAMCYYKLDYFDVSNEIVQHHDWLPTFLAAAGEPAIVEKLKQGHTIGGKTYHVHVDGYDLLPYLTGEVDESPRRGLIYFSDDCDVLGIRYENWKVVFLEQRCQGTLQIWFEPFTELRVPLLFNLRRDPFEKSQHNANTYNDWFLDRPFVVVPLQQLAGKFLMSMKEYPPSQTPGSFNLEKIQKQIEAGARQ
jgi:hypothetical protein